MEESPHDLGYRSLSYTFMTCFISCKYFKMIRQCDHNWFFLTDLYEVAVPLQLNTYPICDLALSRSEKYPAFAYLRNCSFDSLE